MTDLVRIRVTRQLLVERPEGGWYIAREEEWFCEDEPVADAERDTGRP